MRAGRKGSRALAGLTAALTALALLGTGCGDDDDSTTDTGDGTTTTSTDTARPPAHDCPDVAFVNTTITRIRATVDCSEATELAKDVLGRDDCVEETPAGANDCTSGDYFCTSTPEPSAEILFHVRCKAGFYRVKFQQLAPS
jgi:hypothetical protein